MQQFREMAARLAREVAAKRRPRRENTPKQAREAKAQRIEADHLDRVRAALVRLADAHAAGTVPPELAGIRTKAELMDRLRTRLGSCGYYDIHDTREWCDTSPTAAALRAWLDAKPDPGADERKRQAALADAEAGFKFARIDGFFPTPVALAQKLVMLADVRPGHRVLEPSAGTGRIADAAADAGGIVNCVERFRPLAEFLLAKARYNVVMWRDFLEIAPHPFFDRVVMNPPFERAADIKHVEHARKFLKPGGRLVAVVAGGPRQREHFAGRERYDLPDGSFKESGTGVGAAVVVIEA